MTEGRSGTEDPDFGGQGRTVGRSGAAREEKAGVVQAREDGGLDKGEGSTDGCRWTEWERKKKKSGYWSHQGEIVRGAWGRRDNKIRKSFWTRQAHGFEVLGRHPRGGVK